MTTLETFTHRQANLMSSLNKTSLKSKPLKLMLLKNVLAILYCRFRTHTHTHTQEMYDLWLPFRNQFHRITIPHGNEEE